MNRVTRDRRIGAVLEATNATVGFEVSATGFHFLKVLSGDATHSALTRSGTKKWDSCAGEALIRAVGGVVSDAVGRRYDYTPGPPRGGPAADGVQNLCGLLVTRPRRAPGVCGERAARDGAARPVALRRRGPLRPPADVTRASPGRVPRPHRGRRRVFAHAEGARGRDVRAHRARAGASGGGRRRDRARDSRRVRVADSGVESPGVRYAGDGRGFWRPLVANAMGGLALDDPRLEPALDDLYEHYERASSWHVAPGAFRALKRARARG